MTGLFDPAEDLLEEAPVSPGGNLLLMEGGPGPLAARFAKVCPKLVCQNSEIRNHLSAAKTLADLKVPEAHVLLGDIPRAVGATSPPSTWPDAPEFPEGSFDQILYRLGKGTASLNGAICEAWKLLREGGSLFLAGHTREGIKSVARRAEGHFGNIELLILKSSCRLLHFRKHGPAPIEPIPDPAYFEPVPLSLDLTGAGTLSYLSKPGLFSYRSTDPGTALLAGHIPDLEGRTVLDLCCGSGILSLAAFRRGAGDVLAVDSNALAVSVTRRNFQDAKYPGRALCSNLTESVEGRFDVIICNPPFHQGTSTDFGYPERILDAVATRLNPGGRLFLVANQFLDYPAKAKNRFAGCEILAQERGFRVFRMVQ